MKNPKKKVVNIRNGKILELSEVAIDRLKKMGKFTDYDILPETKKEEPKIIVTEADPVINTIEEDKPKKKKVKKEDSDPTETLNDNTIINP